MARSIRIGFVSALGLVLANTIGAGVFTTTGFSLADLGSRQAVLLAWIFGGLHALLGALAYADLAERYPHSGGEYVYVSETLHPTLGRAAGWISLLAGFTSPIAGAVIAAQDYLEHAFGQPHARPWLASALVVVMGFAHAAWPHLSLRLQDLAVYAKAAILALFVVGGALLVLDGSVSSTDHATMAGTPSFGAFFSAFVWIAYAYSGWNAAVYVASEVTDAPTTLRRALVVGTLVVAVLYVGVNAVILYAVPLDAIRGQASAGAIAAVALGGPALGRVLSLIIAFALSSCASSMLLTGPRVYARMAHDGALPKFFAARADIPIRAIGFQALASLAVVWIGSLETVLGFVSFLLGLGTAGSVMGHLRVVLRERRAGFPGKVLRDLLYIVVTLGISVAAAAANLRGALVGLTLLVGLTAWSHFTTASSATRAQAR